MDLTLAICSYRRLEPLKLALQSLCAGAPVSVSWELLIVDNAGDKNIAQLVDSFSGRLPVRYVIEPALGASHARNAAVRLAQAPIILFTDDDVTFDSHWLPRMVAAIQAHPECDLWGGRVEPVWSPAVGNSLPNNPRPIWFDETLFPLLGDVIVQYRQGDTPRLWDPHHDPPFYTANLALRVEKIAEAGYFNTAVGHRGGVRMGMEDSLMVQSLADRGSRGWYAADAVVYHPVLPERITRRYIRKFVWRQGWYSVHRLRQQSPAQRVPRWLYRAAAEEIFRGTGRWLNGWVAGQPARAFAGQAQALFNLAKLWHAVRS